MENWRAPAVPDSFIIDMFVTSWAHWADETYVPLKLAAGGSLGSLLPWGQGKSWIQMMALPRHNCVGLGKWLNLSRPCPSNYRNSPCSINSGGYGYFSVWVLLLIITIIGGSVESLLSRVVSLGFRNPIYFAPFLL